MVHVSQRQEIYRHDQEEMDGSSQLWTSNSELFGFHLDFLMIHRMVELRGEYLALNRDVLEEWLGLESEDQRDLIFRALDRRFEMGEWIWAVHSRAGVGSQSVPLQRCTDAGNVVRTGVRGISKAKFRHPNR